MLIDNWPHISKFTLGRLDCSICDIYLTPEENGYAYRRYVWTYIFMVSQKNSIW